MPAHNARNLGPDPSVRFIWTSFSRGAHMGRGILLWLLGVPIPVIILLAMCSHH